MPTATDDRVGCGLWAAQLKLIRLARAARDRDGRPALTRAEVAAALGISAETYRRRLRDLKRIDSARAAG